MIRLSIRRKIIGIALILIVLMTIAALLSMALIAQVAGRLDDLTQSYVPAYAALAQANIHSLERAVALRRMVIERLQSSPDEAQFAAARKSFEASGQTVDRETKTARALIDALIAKGSTFGDASALVRIDTRLADLTDATRRDLNEEIARVLPLLDGGDRKAIAAGLDRIDELRDQLDQQLDAVRNDMIGLLQADFSGDGTQAADGAGDRHRPHGPGCRFGARILVHRQRRADAAGAPPLGRRARGSSRSPR